LRRRALDAGWIAFIAIVILTGLLTGLVGLIKVQGEIIPLNIETREGCLRDPALVDPQLPCPMEAEAILRYPDGRTVVIRGTPQEVDQRMDPAVAKVVAAERWRAWGICWWRRCWWAAGSQRSPGRWCAVGHEAPGAWTSLGTPPVRPPGEPATLAVTSDHLRHCRPCPPRARSTGTQWSPTDNSGRSGEALTCGCSVACRSRMARTGHENSLMAARSGSAIGTGTARADCAVPTEWPEGSFMRVLS
jgi:hypothetical protein